ncbi:MAG: flavohemoglobin expression-modulating QEGLA motif protein [Gammaproteobacteria bacterium]
MTTLTHYQKTVRALSERLILAQKPIRVLDSIKWDASIQADFFKHKFKKLPPVTVDYYEKYKLSYNPVDKRAEFYNLGHDIRRQLGQFSSVGTIMQRMCHEYRELTRLIAYRGSSEFSKISQELYGSSEDAFYAGAPTLKDLAEMLSSALGNLKDKNPVSSALDEKCYTSEEAVENLQKRMTRYFHDAGRKVRVVLSDGIIADAAAGADIIKIRKGKHFSERDLRVLEVHEGWVHIGTTLNGQLQPICTFLSKGPPSSTVTQEGLAIIIEILTAASYPDRVRRLNNRIVAIHMAEKGANFIEVFNFFREHNLSENDSYSNTVRVFRGSLPDGGGPFTKDLVYNKGFILIYNYIQVAIQQGEPKRIPLLFTGKTTLQDLRALSELIEEGLVIPPKFVPPPFADLAGLSAQMCYTNFISHLNWDRIAFDLKDIL